MVSENPLENFPIIEHSIPLFSDFEKASDPRNVLMVFFSIHRSTISCHLSMWLSMIGENICL